MRVVFLGRSRILWRQAVLQLVTLGIYRRWWLFSVNKEVDGHDALGLNHRGIGLMLWAAAAGALVAIVIATSGLPPALYGLAAAFLLPTAIVQFATARRSAQMLLGSTVKYGPAPLLALLGLVPVLGTLFFVLWQQSRLNRFWAYERAHPGRGVEVDIDIGADPRFLVELDRARRASYYAGSRFDRRREERKARWARRWGSWSEIQAERKAVRDVGGSTPVLPWLRPKRPAHARLHITCGRCSQKFDVERDPAAETPVVCPKCGLAEVLPALYSNPLARPEKAAVPTLSVRCPSCKTQFNAVRNLFGPTAIVCPSCGRKDTVAAAPERAGGRRPSGA